MFAPCHCAGHGDTGPRHGAETAWAGGVEGPLYGPNRPCRTRAPDVTVKVAALLREPAPREKGGGDDGTRPPIPGVSPVRSAGAATPSRTFCVRSSGAPCLPWDLQPPARPSQAPRETRRGGTTDAVCLRVVSQCMGTLCPCPRPEMRAESSSVTGESRGRCRKELVEAAGGAASPVFYGRTGGDGAAQIRGNQPANPAGSAASQRKPTRTWWWTPVPRRSPVAGPHIAIRPTRTCRRPAASWPQDAACGTSLSNCWTSRSATSRPRGLLDRTPGE